MNATPQWFTDALAVEPEPGRVHVGGAWVETLAWGDRGAPGLLFLHGNGCHAHWWRPFAPFFADERRVGALSWSGMGSSDRRSSYSFADHEAEIWTVAETLGLFDGPSKPWIVSHSLGSIAALLAVSGPQGDRFGGLVIVDAGYRPEPRISPLARRRPWSNPSYATLAEGITRFRLVPPQQCANDWIMRFIAEYSLEQRKDGRWHWRFDPEADGTRGIAPGPMLEKAIRTAKCPLAYLWGARSQLITSKRIALNRAIAAPGTSFVEIPEAGHHLMLDQPVAFISALRAILPPIGQSLESTSDVVEFAAADLS
jgi:pimeloyl-ACP methyl ester carboxylesterase